MRPLTRVMLWSALTAIGFLLVLTASYFVRGSLELFPTEEQQNTVRAVTAVLFIVLLAFGVAIGWLLRRWPSREK